MNTAQTLSTAYVYLLAGLDMRLRATSEGQQVLSALRDQVAAYTGMDAEDVQSEHEYRAWKLANE